MNKLINESVPFNPHEFKPIKVIPAEEKLTWLSRHVEWLNKQRHGWSKIGMTAFAVFEKIFLAASVVGLIFIAKEIQESKHQRAKADYFRKAETATPPPDHPIELKSKTHSFNHVQEFAIEDDILWMRLRNSKEDWKPIYFDGFINGHSPKSLDCDGANLIVLDETNAVHYKKVLKEFRKQDLTKDEDVNWLQKSGADLENDEYIAIDKGDRDNWKDKWFSLPFVHSLVNLFTGKRLTIPLDAKAWAISQRGRYDDYLEDKEGNKHSAIVGVTTLYVLDQNGKDIYKSDPWSPKHVKISIPLPESSQMSFEAENISVAASVIMTIGYETQKDDPEKRTLQIYTRLADIDSEGWNPGLKYDYFDQHGDGDIHIIPLPQWISHPLELETGDFVTKNITIVQAGSGNNARELRVEGQHQGQNGFFFKRVDEEEWQFEPFEDLEHEIIKEDVLPLEIDNEKGNFQTTVYNYQSEQVKLRNIKSKEVSARLLDFGPRSYHSKLVLKIDQQEYELDLYKKKTLKNFIGFEGDSYDLVIPEEFHQDPQLMQAFQNQKVIPFKISQNQTELTLQSKNSHFEFIL